MKKRQASLSEGELESNWPCSIQRKCNAEFNEIKNSSPYSGKSGHTDHEAKSKRVPKIILSFGNIVVHRGAVGESLTSCQRGKTP